MPHHRNRDEDKPVYSVNKLFRVVILAISLFITFTLLNVDIDIKLSHHHPPHPQCSSPPPALCLLSVFPWCVAASAGSCRPLTP